jgi:hypothetical protein
MNDDQPRNPLDMYQLYQDGSYVLPQTKCTNRRMDFVGRANSILGFFTVISIASKQGSNSIFKAEQEGAPLTTLHLDSISFPAVPVRISTMVCSKGVFSCRWKSNQPSILDAIRKF